MHHAFLLLAQAGGTQSLMSFVFIGGMIAIMYFLMIRPQQKQLKDHRSVLASLKKGDSVVTQGGLIGKISEITDKEVKLEVAQGVKIRILKSSVQSMTNADAPKAEDKKEEK